jgi:glycosyltransferase involved in cell wall biosynthesis
MTRIAVVSTSYPETEEDPSGHFVRSEVRALERKGCEVQVFVPRGDAFGWPGIVARLRERPSRVASALVELARQRTALHRSGSFSLVIAHWLPTALLARGLAAPLEVVAHGTDVRLVAGLPRVVRARMLSALVDGAETIRAVSEPLARELLCCAAADKRFALQAKIRVAPCAIDLPDVHEESRRKRAGFGGRRLAVTVARLVPSKGVDRVLQRIAQAATPTSIVVVGDGPERPRLEKLAITLGVDARFVGLIPRAEALAWVGAADVIMHASHAEGASTVLREAKALGRTVEAF